MDADIRKIVDEKMKQYYEPIPRAVISGMDVEFNPEDYHQEGVPEAVNQVNAIFGFVDWFIKYCGHVYVPILYIFSLIMLFKIFA